MSNEGACKSGQSHQIINNTQNQNENMTQTEAQIESSPQSLQKIKCTHCKKLYLHVIELQIAEILILSIDMYMIW